MYQSQTHITRQPALVWLSLALLINFEPALVWLSLALLINFELWNSGVKSLIHSRTAHKLFSVFSTRYSQDVGVAKFREEIPTTSKSFYAPPTHRSKEIASGRPLNLSS